MRWWRQNGWIIFYPAVGLAVTASAFTGFFFLALWLA